MKRSILIVDNYDSFTFNLVQQVKENSEHSFTVKRNDEISLEEANGYDAFIFSPGPGLPSEAGLLIDLIKTYQNTKPMFGVCLGMQAMAEANGAELYNLKRPLHGVSTAIDLNKDEMFEGLSQRLNVGRYHSWAVKQETLRAEFIITASDDEKVPMAMRHRELPLYAVQFHPESILTEQGERILSNFLARL